MTKTIQQTNAERQCYAKSNRRTPKTNMQARAQLEQQIVQSLSQSPDIDPQETSEWLEAWDQILDEESPQRATFLLNKLIERARFAGLELPPQLNTPYCNTIPVEQEV